MSATTAIHAEVSSARNLFFDGEVDAALQKLDQVLDGVITTSEEALFDAQCVRLSIKCMLGDSAQVLPSMPVKTQADQLCKWLLEGMSALQEARSSRMASLKFGQIIKNNPHFLGAHIGLAATAYKAQDYPKAFEHFKTVLEIGGAQAPNIVRVGLALCSIRLKQYEHAHLCLKRALSIDPSFVLAHMAKVVVNLSQRDNVSAIQSIRTLYQLIPDNSLAIQKFADYLYIKSVATRSLTEEMISVMRGLIESSSNDPSLTTPAAIADRKAYAAFQNGRLLHYEGRFVEAEAAYIVATKGLPKYAAPKLYLAKLYLNTNRRAEAKNLLIALDVPTSSDRDVLLMLAAINESTGNAVRSIWYAQRLAMEYSTEDPMAWWLLSFVYRKEREESIKYLKKGVIAHDGESHKDWRSQASQHAMQRNEEGLRRLFAERVEGGDLTSPSSVLAALSARPDLLPVVFNFATIQAARSREENASGHATAQRVLVSILKVFPQFKEAYYLLADIAIAHRQFTQARKWLALCITVFPADGMALTTLSRLCAEAGDVKTAEELLKRANRGCPAATLARGALYLRSAQVASEKAPDLMLAAKDCFTAVLRRDHANVLAAHGLACCVSAAGGNLTKRIRMPAAERCLHQVGALKLNDPTLAEGSALHRVNHLVRTKATTSAVTILKRHEDTLTVPQLVSLAFCHATERNFPAALAVIDRAMLSKPNDKGLQYNKLLVLFGSIVHDLGTANVTPELAEDLRRRLQTASVQAAGFVTHVATEGDALLPATLQAAQTNIRRIARGLTEMDEALVKASNRYHGAREEAMREREQWRTRAAALKAEAERAEKERQLREEIDERRRREVHEEWARRNTEFLEARSTQEGAEHREYVADNQIAVFENQVGGEFVDANAELLGALGENDAEEEDGVDEGIVMESPAAVSAS